MAMTDVACTNVQANIFEMFHGTYLKCLVKIGSVTAEIFLIWTNIAMTNVAWTNVNVIVSISARCSKEHSFKVL